MAGAQPKAGIDFYMVVLNNKGIPQGPNHEGRGAREDVGEAWRRWGTTYLNQIFFQPQFAERSRGSIKHQFKEETISNTQPSGGNGHESYNNNYAPLIVWEVSVHWRGLGI